MATSLPPTETLQLIVLHALEAEPIRDSRQLQLALPANVDGAQSVGAPRPVGAGADEQNVLKGALDSLVAREVRSSSCPRSVAAKLGRRFIVTHTDIRVALQMIKYEQLTDEAYVLTTEGQQIAAAGSHEYIVWNALPRSDEPPMSAQDIAAKVGKDTAKVGQGKAMKNKWISKKGDGFVKAVSSGSCQTGHFGTLINSLPPGRHCHR